MTTYSLASNQSTLKAKFNGKISKAEDGSLKISGVREFVWSDTYDWNQGNKVTRIPGVGEIWDNDGLCLEKTQKGRAFRMNSSKVDRWEIETSY